MPRRPRRQLRTTLHHVTARGNNRQVIFWDELDQTRFLELLALVVARYGWTLHDYCLMNNHIHLLIEAPQPELSRGMWFLLCRYSIAHNVRHTRREHLFGRRFHVAPVTKLRHRLAVSRYIAMNPVRALLCAAPDDYEWSSYRAMAGLDEPPRWLSVEPTRALFAEGGVDYASFVAAGQAAGDDDRPALADLLPIEENDATDIEWAIAAYGYKLHEVAAHYGVSRRTISRWIADGVVPIGKRLSKTAAEPIPTPYPGCHHEPARPRTREESVSDPFGARTPLTDHPGVDYFRLERLDEVGVADTTRLPYTVRVLLEILLRNAGSIHVSEDDVRALARWPEPAPASASLAFLPARVILQDFTGVPAVVDLAAMRAAMARAGKDPGAVDPLVPADLVIDHSVQVDAFGTRFAYARNIEREYERNRERYALLRWAQGAFGQFRVVPPGMGIIHQVNLEHLGQVVTIRDGVAIPDTLVGTDSHTTMIDALGILGWGVGGIEAEAVLLGEPLVMPTPIVIGVEFQGALRSGATATDLVLTLTELLRAHGVVGQFVEFCGDGLSALSIPDRATLSNMAPEYGATAATFPVDAETIGYLQATGRGAIAPLVEVYTRSQGMWRSNGDPLPTFSEHLALDLGSIVPSVAGPRRPQDRVPLNSARESFFDVYPRDPHPVPIAGRDLVPTGAAASVAVLDAESTIDSGSVVIAAITSCTNTSNPSVMIAAGLLARNAVARGLESKPWVKTSLAPGSRVVTGYLERAGLTEPLEALRFNLVGYGCTTCIGNSGPLAEPIERAIAENDLVAVAVLSGNRNFEGRIHPRVRASYLASPPLVVAYALAGTIDIDLESEPLGVDRDGDPVHLADIWPSPDEVRQVIADAIDPSLYETEYARVWDGDANWKAMPAPEGALFAWDDASTYVREPPYFDRLTPEPTPVTDVIDARVLAVLGDSVTTDHISPAGSIPADGPAGRYLIDHGVERAEFNAFGARRGNHEVMIRGTFGNIRLRNLLVEGAEGSITEHLPSGERMAIFDAAERYRSEDVPLIVLAGKEYGSGSSRDWAAKGTLLLGVRAVIAESYERIHRSNLVGMGVLPLQFRDGETPAVLGLTGRERFTIRGVADLTPRSTVQIEAVADDGTARSFAALVRIDGLAEVEYLRHGGILPMVLRRMIATAD